MNSHKTKNFFQVSAEDFKKIPGSPIAYWTTEKTRKFYTNLRLLSEISPTKDGITTGNNDLFIKLWYEVSLNRIGVNLPNRQAAKISQARWFPYSKGGSFRKWFGNIEYVINWANDGAEISIFPKAYPRNKNFYFKEGITWTLLSSGNAFGARILPQGCIFDVNSKCSFPLNPKNLPYILSFLVSTVAHTLILNINPTMAFQAGDIAKLPCKEENNILVVDLVTNAIRLTQSDWDSYETSWDFQMNPLLAVENGLNVGDNQFDLSAIYIALRRDWQRQTEEMRRLEIENNRIFIDAYGLQDELSPEVPWNEITLTCNPWYRYGKNIENFDAVGNDFVLGKKDRIEILPVNNNESDERPADAFPFAKETEERLLEDTIKEYISYAVGCMMGRYSPEKPGLILANQPISGQDDEIEYQTAITGSNIFGELGATRYFTIKDGKRKITSYSDFYDVFGDEGNYHQFMDRDGVLPILDEEWFLDDIVAQFKAFLQFTFGAEHFADNLDFIEKALGKDIRKYFIKDFYKDHVQRYKKRPIYWMFSSPKGSFNALIYMHRYRPDTVSIVLNEYLREFISKIRSHREHLITENNRATLAPAEKTRNLKLIDKYAAMLTELDAYERDILYPLAQQKIAIDLDDGVKVNYCKFGAALKKIPGLEAKEE